jgi:Ca-activated chloride channel homolog
MPVAGRHQSSPTLEKSRRLKAPLLVMLILGAVVVGAGLSIAALEYPSHSGSADAAAATSCVTRPALTVVAAPSISGAIAATAKHWLAGHPTIGGACPTITVQSADSATEETSLAKPGAVLPDLWVTDSSVWLTRLRADATSAGTKLSGEVSYPSIAMSPLVLATTAGHQSQLAAAAAKGWTSVLASNATPMALVDPTTSTDGLLALLTANSTSSSALPATLKVMAHSTITTAATGLTDLRAHPATASSFPASEQEVINANLASPAGGTPVAMAVYPAGVSLQLDFPVAQFSPAGTDAAQQVAAAAFVSQLAQPFAAQQFNAAGLRDPAGDPVTPDQTALGASPPVVTALAPPSMAQIAATLKLWTNAIAA